MTIHITLIPIITIIILIKLMRQKTDYDQKQSISTKVTPSAKAASFTINAKREMYLQKTNRNNQIQKINNNVVILNPDFSAFSITDQILALEDGNHFIVLQDGFYTIIADRTKPAMIPRTCQPQSQLLFCSAKRPASTIFLESIHLYSNRDFPSMLHINISKYNIDQYSLQSKNIHLALPPKSKVLSFTTLQNSKKGFIVLQKQVKNPEAVTYQFIYFSLAKQNKYKNPNFKHNKAKIRKFGEDSDCDNDDEETKKKKQVDLEYIVEEIETVRKQFTMDPTKEHYKKVINSEFGDALLFITNRQIYNIQIDGKEIEKKPTQIQQQIRKYLNEKMEVNNPNHQELMDVNYIVNGLKIIFITASNLVGYISAEKVIGMVDVGQEAAKKQKYNKYSQGLKVCRLYPMIERVVLQTKNNSLIIMKQQHDEAMVTTSIEKVIQIMINEETNLHGFKVSVIPENQEIVLNKIVTNQQKKLMHLEIGKKTVLSPGNEFVPMYRTGYKAIQSNDVEALKLLPQHIQQYGSIQISQNQQRHPVISQANGILCYLKDHEVHFMRLYEGFTTQKNSIESLFSVSFFEKPLQVSIDPYGSVVIILFKQFVKFFKFEYQKLTQFYTYNVRGVNYAGFSDSGQYILMVVDDILYFVNPFTYETEKSMEAYGQIKSIHNFDTSLYILLKNKISAKSSAEQYLHSYLQDNGLYTKVSEIKIDPEERYYVDRKFLIICSKTKIKVYYYDYFQSSDEKRVQKLKTKEITLFDYYQYPTAVTLSEEFGVLFIGTNYGRIYEYLWPFPDPSADQYTPNQFYAVRANNSDICMIRIGTCLEKIITFAKSGQITQFQINQYIELEETQTPYVISPSTLYSAELKYQFASRQYLYQKHTSYLQQYAQQSNQAIQEQKFIIEKLKDDIEQQSIKANNKLEEDMQEIAQMKQIDIKEMKKQFNEQQEQMKVNKERTNEQLADFLIKKNKQRDQMIQQYERTMLELYKEADRLKGIYRKLQTRFRKEKDQYILTNNQIRQKLISQYEGQLDKYESKFKGINLTAKDYCQYVKIENEEMDQELQQYKSFRHREIEEEIEMEEHLKESLLGSIQQYIKEINNLKQRRDQFESLAMQTNLQIDELYADRKQYEEKKKYLEKQLQNKEDMIEQKEKELIIFVKNTEMMKKIKMTHNFELVQYEKEFQPMALKLTEIQNKIKKMNAEIFNQFNNRQKAEEDIETNTTEIYQLKRKREDKILKKHKTATTLSRFFSQLALLLQKDPLAPELRRKLNDLVNGQTFESNQEEVIQKEKNSKLIRKKDFIRKQIEEQEKREQQIVRNKNLYFHYYNDNTALVNYFNELKQEETKLLTIKEKLTKNIEETKKKLAVAPRQMVRGNSSKSHSMLQSANKKFSEKLLTPYQRYQQDQIDLLWAKGATEQTKVGSISNRKNMGGESSKLLQSLMKDVGKSESVYEKMQVVRDRVRSFVNPQLKIKSTKKNNLNVQRMLFETRKLVEDEQYIL